MTLALPLSLALAAAGPVAAKPIVPAINDTATKIPIGQRTANSFGMIPPVMRAASERAVTHKIGQRAAGSSNISVWLPAGPAARRSARRHHVSRAACRRGSAESARDGHWTIRLCG